MVTIWKEIGMLNSIAIDTEYKGKIMVFLYNHGPDSALKSM